MSGTIWVLVLNIVCMLVLTLIIATSTLIERKFLSLMQRRVGPQFVGYKGRLQYIADALKLFGKGVLVPDEANKFWFITIPSVVVALCYSFWMNAVWGPSFGLFEIEYNLLYVALFSILFGLCILLTGFFSRNKYAMLAAVRAGIGLLNLELFLGLMILNVVVISGSFSFLALVVLQEVYWFIFLFFGLSGLIVITFLLETNRAPFDLSEAESELVAGYTVEYGGFFFGLYYLGEYLHLFFFSLVTVFLFFGGWELPNFLWVWASSPYFIGYNTGNFVMDTVNYYYTRICIIKSTAHSVAFFVYFVYAASFLSSFLFNSKFVIYFLLCKFYEVIYYFQIVFSLDSVVWEFLNFVASIELRVYNYFWVESLLEAFIIFDILLAKFTFVFNIILNCTFYFFEDLALDLLIAYITFDFSIVASWQFELWLLLNDSLYWSEFFDKIFDNFFDIFVFSLFFCIFFSSYIIILIIV